MKICRKFYLINNRNPKEKYRKRRIQYIPTNLITFTDSTYDSIKRADFLKSPPPPLVFII